MFAKHFSFVIAEHLFKLRVGISDYSIFCPNEVNPFGHICHDFTLKSESFLRLLALGDVPYRRLQELLALQFHCGKEHFRRKTFSRVLTLVNPFKAVAPFFHCRCDSLIGRSHRVTTVRLLGRR